MEALEMRLGWLADPRAHVALLGIGIGAFLFFPEMAQVTERVERQAADTVERVAEDALLVLGIEPASPG
jgi:hypothetical protein